MKRSTERILTTHAGSLPRPPDLLEMIRARENGESVDGQAFAARVRSAVADIVRQQAEAGIDVVSDGEMGKTGFANYVPQQIAGFGGENTDRRIFADQAAFPEFRAEQASVASSGACASSRWSGRAPRRSRPTSRTCRMPWCGAGRRGRSCRRRRWVSWPTNW